MGLLQAYALVAKGVRITCSNQVTHPRSMPPLRLETTNSSAILDSSCMRCGGAETFANLQTELPADGEKHQQQAGSVCHL